MRMLRIDNNKIGADKLTKKENTQYTVERVFLSKFSIEELLVRIVKSHVKQLRKGEEKS